MRSYISGRIEKRLQGDALREQVGVCLLKKAKLNMWSSNKHKDGG